MKTNTTFAVDYLKQLESRGFYGSVELRYEAGKLVHLVERRSLKPNNLPDMLGGNYDNNTKQ